VEDQQPATGDLTEESAVDTAAAETEAAPVDPAVDEADTENVDETIEDEATDDDVEDGVVRFREHRQAGRWTTVAAVVADCADPSAVTGFWAMATGWAPATSTASGLSLRSPDGLGPYLELLPSADPKTGKNRVHLDVAPQADEDHAAAIVALTGAGAVRLDIGQRNVPWTVLADPEGSEFCVLSPR